MASLEGAWPRGGGGVASRELLSPQAVLVEIPAQHRADVGCEPGGGQWGEGGGTVRPHMEPTTPPEPLCPPPKPINAPPFLFHIPQ